VSLEPSPREKKEKLEKGFVLVQEKKKRAIKRSEPDIIIIRRRGEALFWKYLKKKRKLHKLTEKN